MISYLKGKIQHKGSNYIEVLVSSIGYTVFIADDFLKSATIGQEIEIFTFQHVKEDALDLYGFDSRNKLELFEKLISISGIGPKSALGVLSSATVEEIESAIIRGDATILTKVSGIGKKTAERIVLELKNKFTGTTATTDSNHAGSEDADVIDGLVGLGYPIDHVREALRKIDSDITGTEEKIKACLQILGSNA